MSSEFARYSPSRRVRQEIEYSRTAARAVIEAKPDVAVFSNVPLLALALLARTLRKHKVPYVFWQQDVYSAAIDAFARRQYGVAGAVIGWIARRAEKQVAGNALAVVPISETFVRTTRCVGDTAVPGCGDSRLGRN